MERRLAAGMRRMGVGSFSESEIGRALCDRTHKAGLMQYFFGPIMLP